MQNSGKQDDKMLKSYLNSLNLVNECFKKSGNASQGTINLFLNSMKYVLKTCTDVYLGLFRDDYDICSLKESEVAKILNSYEEKMESISSEYGFDFAKSDMYNLEGETDCFLMYKINPTKSGVVTKENTKPVLIKPGFMNGPNILCLLPNRDVSYVHAWANNGVPTYVMIPKDIQKTEAVQIMTGEDDVIQTRDLCSLLNKKHENAVTLNGYGQGGYLGACGLLTDKFTNEVDIFISCASPFNGAKSKVFGGYIEDVSTTYNEVCATKMLPSGNWVVDGKLMSQIFAQQILTRDNVWDDDNNDVRAAFYKWVTENIDMPVAIAQMSYDSYRLPIKDGTLPVKLFGETLNFKAMEEKGINTYIAHVSNDNIVDTRAALDVGYLCPEIATFPSVGMAPLATYWCKPCLEYSLDRNSQDFRGPIQFHLDTKNLSGKSDSFFLSLF